MWATWATAGVVDVVDGGPGRRGRHPVWSTAGVDDGVDGGAGVPAPRRGCWAGGAACAWSSSWTWLAVLRRHGGSSRC